MAIGMVDRRDWGHKNRSSEVSTLIFKPNLNNIASKMMFIKLILK